ncbi:hypothetical protein IQ07DRAFT_209994 [Pyrenochaeta sp. DS3sAY3a]|nr:hypothetical protein IQ07DRAFT_209994 [Pyrenochaeta sp. DS3sAY3a]
MPSPSAASMIGTNTPYELVILRTLSFFSARHFQDAWIGVSDLGARHADPSPHLIREHDTYRSKHLLLTLSGRTAGYTGKSTRT